MLLQIPCSSSPCQHFGRCVNKGIDRNYTCYCPGGFTGKNCEIQWTVIDIYGTHDAIFFDPTNI